MRGLEGALSLPELELELTHPGTEIIDKTLKRSGLAWLESWKPTIHEASEKPSAARGNPELWKVPSEEVKEIEWDCNSAQMPIRDSELDASEDVSRYVVTSRIRSHPCF